MDAKLIRALPTARCSLVGHCYASALHESADSFSVPHRSHKVCDAWFAFGKRNTRTVGMDTGVQGSIGSFFTALDKCY